MKRTMKVKVVRRRKKQQSERMASVFTKAMEESLIKNQVLIVSKLSNLEGIMDHLLVGGVFVKSERVFKSHETEEKIRNLLDALMKRPDKDYWTFVKSLYHERQEHIADEILKIYVKEGGTIPRDYHDLHQRLENAGSSAPPPTPLHQGPAQLQFQSPTNDHPTQPPNNQLGLSLGGNPVSIPSGGGDAGLPQRMDVDSDRRGSQPQGSTVADQASGACKAAVPVSNQ